MQFKFFPAFFEKPQGISFINQEPNEVIELFLRRHFITNVPWIVISIIGLVLPLILAQLDGALNINLLLQIPTQLIIGALIVYYELLVAYILENFLFWYYNIYIVTNLHVIDIRFASLLSRSVVDLEMDDIKTVTAQIRGVFGSLFNYGDVVIMTDAREQITFTDVPQPDFVADRIEDLRAIFIGGGG